jgi:hypothetical protein
MDAAVVLLLVLVIYVVYFVAAVRAIKVVWRRTEQVPDRKRVLLRSLAAAVLFAPTIAGARIAPFLLAVVASVVLDLIFVEPLTLQWAASALHMFFWFMFLPFLVTWAGVLAWMLFARHLKQKNNNNN